MITPKHIVIDARTSGTSTGRYVDKLVEHLHKLESPHRFTILAKSPRLDYFNTVSPRFAVQRCDVKEFTFAEQLTLKKQLEQLKPDLVHFTMVQQPVLYRGAVVTTMNDLTTLNFLNPAKNSAVMRAKQLVYRWVNQRVARQSRHIITFTNFVRDDIIKLTGQPASKFTTTYLAADPITAPAEALPQLKDQKFVLYVGQPFPHKNLNRLIDAFVKLQVNDPDVRLVLAGKLTAPYRFHVDRVKHEGIQNVVFTDFVSDGQLRWLYAHCAVYAFPSLSEGFGLPGLEAILEGAPVAASKVSCLPEVYQDGAHYFDPLNTDDIAAKISEVINQPSLAAELKKRGAAVAKQYSWDKTAKQTLEVYERVLDA